jgi:hypothetical protein
MHFSTLLTLLLPAFALATSIAVDARQQKPLSCVPDATYCGWFIQENCMLSFLFAYPFTEFWFSKKENECVNKVP